MSKNINPFKIFSISLVFVFLLYELSFSKLYPSLSNKMLIFLLVLILLFSSASYFFKKINWKIKEKDVSSSINLTTLKILTMVVVISTLGEGIYSRGFPLFGSTLLNYGIPTFHVILTVGISYLTINIFNFGIENNFSRQIIFLIFINILCLLVTLSRSVIVITLLDCFWLLLYKYKKKKKRKSKKILRIFLVLIIIYLFGLLGNYRSNMQLNNQNKSIFNSDFIYQVGSANEEFTRHPGLGPFFWDYLYTTSSLANLQNLVNNKDNLSFKESNKPELASQYMPDFMSKRIFSELNTDTSGYRISPVLTVGTVFYLSYYLAGWYGIFLMLIFMLIFPFLYLLLISHFCHEYFYIALSLLNTIYMLNLFSNMFSFSVTSLILVFPFITKVIKIIKDREIIVS